MTWGNISWNITNPESAFCLTNKEALTVLCSVVKHCRLLSALQQNRTQSRLLHLFYDKESDNFPTHSAEFSSQTLFSKRVKVAFSDKARYNKPITIIVRIVQII